jgi:hypothetical protein
MQVNAANFHAFKLGLADRLAGRPMTAHEGQPDEGETVDAYAMGYDPHDEMGLTLPEFLAETRIFIAECVRQIPGGVPMNMPRNKCEFPS